MTPLHREYFDWQPIGDHAPGCRESRWEVRRLRRDRHDDGYEAGLRALCRSCGTVYQLVCVVNGQATWGDDPSCASHQATTTGSLGYGLPAERVGGLWLHPGPPLWQSEPPREYLVTFTRQTPLTPAEVLGMVARQRGRRGGLLWTAAYGYRPAARASEGHKSRISAVRWLAEQLREASEEATA